MAFQQPQAWPLGQQPDSLPSDDNPPPPPVHRTPVGMHQQRQDTDPNNYSDYSTPGVTPGSDNMGDTAAGGGINGIANGVASNHPRESGMQAARGMPGPGRPMGVPNRNSQSSPFNDPNGYDQPMVPRQRTAMQTLTRNTLFRLPDLGRPSLP